MLRWLEKVTVDMYDDLCSYVQSIDSSVLQGKACRMLEMRNQQRNDVQSRASVLLEIQYSKARHTAII